MAASEEETGEEDQCARRYLSIEMHEEIVLRLPWSCARQFRGVCRQWRGIVDEPRFVQRQLGRAQERRAPAKTLLFFDSTQADSPADALVFDDFRTPPRCLWKASSPEVEFAMIGTCNGLLCLYKPRNDAIVLANPVTCETLALPTPAAAADGTTLRTHESYSFGFHPATQQYKILHLPCTSDLQVDAVMVYTLGGAQWRPVATPGLTCSVHDGVVGANGAAYWLTKAFDRIVAFDLGAEHAAAVELPPKYRLLWKRRRRYHKLSLTAVDTRLCLAAMVDRATGCKLELWHLEDGAGRRWSCTHSVHFCGAARWVARPHFVHGEHLLAWGRSHCLYAHDLEEGDGDVWIGGASARALPINHVGLSTGRVRAFVYVESFAPLKIYKQWQ